MLGVSFGVVLSVVVILLTYSQHSRGIPVPLHHSYPFSLIWNRSTAKKAQNPTLLLSYSETLFFKLYLKKIY